MKILQIADWPNWAIGHLTQLVAKHNPHIEFKQLYIHPKEVEKYLMDDQKKKELLDALGWCDMVDLQYWNTVRQLLELVPELHTKKLILTHHNQKDLLAYDWKDITHHVVHTQYAANVLVADGGYENVAVIPYGFDLDFFKYRETEPSEKIVGYCGRVVPWKGLKEIARACFELGYGILAMGKIDKPSYWEEIPPEHRAIIDFSYMNAPDDQRAEFYNDITIYVGNSGPNHEEGTMPMQEAMACGVPVVTTPSGVAADMLEDRKNALVVPYGDYDQLKAAIKELMEDAELREQLRREAWQTIKLHTEERMAWEFEKVFHKVLDPVNPLVSVIIPSTLNPNDHEESTVNISSVLDALSTSTYPHIEAVIGLDHCTGVVDSLQAEVRSRYNFPIKFVCTERLDGYNLAMSRNLAVLQAQGEYLLFCDNRLAPFEDAVMEFMEEEKKHHKEKVWLFGEKGSGKKSFVENFSFIRRDYFIRAGMMNERINHYGGMSQELRARFQWQGFDLIYTPKACAKQLRGSKLTSERRQDIIKSKLQLWRMGLK